jgi:hypothetical protein
MISRKQELSLQINQIADGLLLILTLYIGYALRRYQIIDFDILPSIPPLEEFFWMFLVIGLFGPLLLELQGFYQYPLEKSLARSVRQIASAGVWLGLALGACVVFFRHSQSLCLPAFHRLRARRSPSSRGDLPRHPTARFA